MFVTTGQAGEHPFAGHKIIVNHFFSVFNKNQHIWR